MSEANRIIVYGVVKVNGEAETDHYRQLIEGDVIEFRKQTLVYTEEDGDVGNRWTTLT